MDRVFYYTQGLNSRNFANLLKIREARRTKTKNRQQKDYCY